MSRVEMAEQLDQQLPATRNLHESLSRAEELATRRKHSVVGLDHLLLALGQDPEAVAVLLVCKVDVEALCMDLLRKLGPEARMRSPNTVPPSFDVTVQNLIAHASAAALQAGHTEIDGSNILSAIISGEGGMITHKILQKHGLTFNETVLNLEKKLPNQDEKQTGAKQHENTRDIKTQQDEEQNENFKLVPEVPGKESDKKELTAEGDNLNRNAQAVQNNHGASESIVQSEARPEDYGMTVEGREYHPVPPGSNKAPDQAPSKQQQEAQSQAIQGTPPPARPEAGRMPGSGKVPHQTEGANNGPLKEQGQQQPLARAETVPPQEMQNGMPAPAQRPPAQPVHTPHQQPVNEHEPLPSILKNQDPQALRVENQGQRNQAPNDLSQGNEHPVTRGLPSSDEQAASRQAKGKKVSFNQGEAFAPPAEREKSQGQQTVVQSEDKFIKEDKYGTIPPKLPTPPHPGHINLTEKADQAAENLSQSELQSSHKEKTKSLTSSEVPPGFPEGKEQNSYEQDSKNPNIKNHGAPHNTPLNLPPLGREGVGFVNGQPVRKEQLEQPGHGQLPGQGHPGKAQLFPAQNSGQPQVRQHPVQPGQPPLNREQTHQGQHQHGQPQYSQTQYNQTQQKMDGIANSISQNQKNKELLGDQDQVVENIPKVMRVGKVHYLEVRVAKFANAEIELAPEDYGLRSKQNGSSITKAITVRLTGPDGLFLIDCATASTQWTEMQGGITNDADFSIWRWRVLPRKSGISKLRLDITARTSNEDGLTAEIPIQPSKSIDIKVTRNYGSISKKLIILAGIFAVGFGVAQYGEKTYKFAQEQIEEFSRVD